MTVMELVTAYIGYRRSLGYRLSTTEWVLKSMAAHTGTDADLDALSQGSCSAFLSPADASTVTPIWFVKYSAMKGLFLWAMSRGYMKEVPLSAETPRRLERARPYIYSDAELKKLFDCALTCRTGRKNIHPHTLRYILMLTYMLGLRISETVELRVDDIDLGNYTVLIRESKHHKSRIVTFNGQVSSVLRAILVMRDGMPTQTGDAHVFQTRKGKPVTTYAVKQE